MSQAVQRVHVHHPALVKITRLTPQGEKIILDGLSSLAEGRLESDVIFPLLCPATIAVTTLTGKTYTYTIPLKEIGPPMIVEHLDDILDVNVPSPTDGYHLAWDQATGLWIAKEPSFLNLLDTPSTYVDKAGQAIVVKPEQDGLAFTKVHQANTCRRESSDPYNVQTTSETYVVLMKNATTELAVTMTTGNNPVLIIFFGVAVGNGAAGKIFFQLQIDDTPYVYETACETHNPASGKGGPTTSTMLQTVSAGEHTFRVLWHQDGLTSADCYTRAITVIELKA